MKRSRDVQIDKEIDFKSLITNKSLLKGLEQAGYSRPSPIQLQAIPLGRLGVDLIAQAKSGTGKTVVFGTIALETINPDLRSPQVLVVAPTREIAVQIRDVFRGIGKYVDGFSCEAIIGGLDVKQDAGKLRNCQAVVGTPGRLMALLHDKVLKVKDLKLVVLDEADKLMGDTFFAQTKYIHAKLPAQRQEMAFSATFTEELLEQLSQFMKTPQVVRLTADVPSLEEVRQYYVDIDIEDKPNEQELFRTLRTYKAKFEKTADLLSRTPFYQCMIFLNSVPRAVELARWLTEMGWASEHISANLSQHKRLEVMEKMRNFHSRVLVCSDLLARGIDIDRVNLVVNLDFPRDSETYMHRVGRTGRFGTSGIAVNLVGPEDQAFQSMLQEKGVQILPLPDVLSYGDFLKDLNTDEQKTLDAHQQQRAEKESERIEYTPAKLVKSLKHSTKSQQNTDSEDYASPRKKRIRDTESSPPASSEQPSVASPSRQNHKRVGSAPQTGNQTNPHHDPATLHPYPYPHPYLFPGTFGAAAYPPFASFAPPYTPSPWGSSAYYHHPTYLPPYPPLPYPLGGRYPTESHFIPPDLYF